MLGVAGFGLIQLLPLVMDSGSWPLYMWVLLCVWVLAVRTEFDSASSMAWLGICAGSTH